MSWKALTDIEWAHVRWFWLAVALALGFALACGPRTARDVFLDRARLIQLRVTPHGLPLPQLTEPRRNQWLVETSWRFKVPWRWEDYAGWARARLGDSFSVTMQDSIGLRFRRPGKADVEELDLNAESWDGKATAVRAAFRAEAW